MVLSFCLLASPVFAVDGAGAGLFEISHVLVYFVVIASPFLALVGAAFLLVKLANRIMHGPQKPNTDLLPPSSGDIQFTEEEATLMQDFGIFFNGRQYRLNDQKFDTLPEAIAAAASLRGFQNDA